MVDGKDCDFHSAITTRMLVDLIARTMYLEGSQDACFEGLKVIEPSRIWLDDSNLGAFHFALGNALDKLRFVLDTLENGIHRKTIEGCGWHIATQVLGK